MCLGDCWSSAYWSTQHSKLPVMCEYTVLQLQLTCQPWHHVKRSHRLAVVTHQTHDSTITDLTGWLSMEVNMRSTYTDKNELLVYRPSMKMKWQPFYPHFPSGGETSTRLYSCSIAEALLVGQLFCFIGAAWSTFTVKFNQTCLFVVRWCGVVQGMWDFCEWHWRSVF